MPLWAQQQSLPAAKKESTEAPLGEAQAVQEVRRFVQEREKLKESQGSYSETSAAGPPVIVPVKEEKKAETKSDPSIFRPKRYWGLRAGAFLPGGELGRHTGSGWGFGGLLRSDLDARFEVQFNVDWIYALNSKSDQKNSLYLLPWSVGVRFPKSLPLVARTQIVLEPSLGGVFWWSKATRFLDNKKNQGKGFDFLASFALSLEYEWQENSFFALPLRYQYGAGYINHAWWTFGLEWTKKF